MLAQSSDGLEVLRLWDESGESFELKIPKSPAGEGELALERRSGDLALKADPNTPGNSPLTANPGGATWTGSAGSITLRRS
mgnify:CR=1 FL=1